MDATLYSSFRTRIELYVMHKMCMRISLSFSLLFFIKNWLVSGPFNRCDGGFTCLFVWARANGRASCRKSLDSCCFCCSRHDKPCHVTKQNGICKITIYINKWMSFIHRGNMRLYTFTFVCVCVCGVCSRKRPIRAFSTAPSQLNVIYVGGFIYLTEHCSKHRQRCRCHTNTQSPTPVHALFMEIYEHWFAKALNFNFAVSFFLSLKRKQIHCLCFHPGECHFLSNAKFFPCKSTACVSKRGALLRNEWAATASADGAF